MRTPIALVLRAVIGAAAFVEAANGEPADWVLTNGEFVTMNGAKPRAEAVVVRDDKFVYVGDASGAAPFVSSGTRTTDLGGALVIPGIVDGHTHPGYIGIERYGEPWLPATSKRDVLRTVKRYADSHRDIEWIRMCCWPSNLYGVEGPDKRDLDAILPDRPVWLTSDVWHSAWLNSKALEVLRVDRHTPDPLPGVALYVRDSRGEPTGWIKEGAAWQFANGIFDVDADAHEKAVMSMLDFLSTHGVTALYDGGNFGHEDRVYAFLAKLDRLGKLPIRYEGTYQVFTPQRKYAAIAEMQRLRQLHGGSRLRFNTIKLFMDGVTKERTAAMLEPYPGEPDNRGNTMMTAEELRDFLLELHVHKLDLHVHVLGDRSVRTVLDAVEAAQRLLHGALYTRVTLAHLAIIDDADYARIESLGVIANFTPQWHGVAYDDAIRRALGDERYAKTFIVKPLIDLGAIVSFSSDDWMLSDISPFLGMQVGHTRRFPKEWIPRAEIERGFDVNARRGPATERLDLETLIRGYTINGAYQLRMEQQLGSIEAGKLADLVVLDRDLFEMNPENIHLIKPAAVIMDGKLIHGRL